MAAGDNYRRISPADQLVFDTAGRLVGIRAGLADAEMRAGTPEELEAMQVAIPLRASVSATLLIGDSNLSFCMDQAPSVTAVTDHGNGTATITFSGSHNFSVGQPVVVNNSTTEALNTFDGVVLSQVNSGTFSITYSLGTRRSPVVSGVAASTQVLYPLRRSPIGMPTWLEAMAGRNMGYIMAAAGGADATQARTMFDDARRTALAAKVSDVIVMIGTNDVYSRAWDFETARAAIKSLLDRIADSMPARIWWLTIPPLNSSAGAWSSGKQTVVNRLNRWIWRYGPQIGAYVIDTWKGTQNGAALVNGAASNPDATSNFLGADGTHTTNLGALAIARAEFTAQQQVAAFQALGFQAGHSAMQTQGNALTNPQLTGTGGTKTAGSGTINGNAPDSWTVEITSGSGTLDLTQTARTVAADGDASGNNLQVIPSVAALTWRLINTTSIHTAVTAGEVREASIPITITDAAGLTGIELILFGANSTAGNTNIGVAGTSQAITGAFSGVLRIPRWTVPAGLTSLVFFLRFTQTGTPAGTFIIGKPSLELVE